MRSKRLEDIEKKIADLKALAADEKRRLSSKERKRETRRKILFTGEIYARLRRQEKITLICESANGQEQVTFHNIHDVEKWVLQNLSRPADFTAFDVDVSPEEAPESQPIVEAEKIEKPKAKKPEPKTQVPLAPAIAHPATLVVQGTSPFPQSSTNEDKPPSKATAKKPANSNQPKASKTGAKRLPEVGQDEMKKQFMM